MLDKPLAEKERWVEHTDRTIAASVLRDKQLAEKRQSAMTQYFDTQDRGNPS